MKRYEQRGFTNQILQIFEDLETYKNWCRFEGKPFTEADLYKPQTTWGKYEAYLRRKGRDTRRRNQNNDSSNEQR